MPRRSTAKTPVALAPASPPPPPSRTVAIPDVHTQLVEGGLAVRIEPMTTDLRVLAACLEFAAADMRRLADSLLAAGVAPKVDVLQAAPRKRVVRP